METTPNASYHGRSLYNHEGRGLDTSKAGVLVGNWQEERHLLDTAPEAVLPEWTDVTTDGKKVIWSKALGHPDTKDTTLMAPLRGLDINSANRNDYRNPSTIINHPNKVGPRSRVRAEQLYEKAAYNPPQPPVPTEYKSTYGRAHVRLPPTTTKLGARHMKTQDNVPHPKHSYQPLKNKHIIIAGPPAGGKGTQCEKIVARYGVTHISTGDLLRAHVAAQTEIGVRAKGYMDSGSLVPDDLVIDMVRERLLESDCQYYGWLLDGFPRTRAQADALESFNIRPDKVILLEVPDEDILVRVTGRRLDPVTGKIYHVLYNPVPEAKDIRNRVTIRSDDTEEKARERLNTYYDNLQAITEVYHDKITKVDGKGVPDTIFKSVIDALEKPVKERKTIILTGPPCSGKYTQANKLAERFGLVHISTGHLLREQVDANSEIGEAVRGFVERGDLVPDELICDLIWQRLQEQDTQKCGWILNGFPRTRKQAEMLFERNIIPEYFFVLEAPRSVVMDRVCGMRVDPVTGKVYDIVNRPPVNRAVSHRLEHASSLEHITNRVNRYEEHIVQVMGLYDKIVQKFDGTDSIDVVGRNLLSATEKPSLKAPGLVDQPYHHDMPITFWTHRVADGKATIYCSYGKASFNPFNKNSDFTIPIQHYHKGPTQDDVFNYSAPPKVLKDSVWQGHIQPGF